MRNIEIESGIPIPQTRRMYPFEYMDIGDSFALTPNSDMVEEHGMDEAIKRLRSSLISAASSYARRHDSKFVVRRVAEDTIRCWRVDPE